MRLMLVDDDALNGEGVRAWLEACGVDIAGLVPLAQDGVTWIGDGRPDVVLVGLETQGRAGLEALRQIRAQDPGVRLLALVREPEDDRLFEAFCAGASGYLSRAASREAVLEALSGVARGESPMSRGLCQRILEALSIRDSESGAGGVGAPCSERQWHILVKLAEGHTYREVAGGFGISESAVKYHLREILQRLPGRLLEVRPSEVPPVPVGAGSSNA